MRVLVLLFVATVSSASQTFAAPVTYSISTRSTTSGVLWKVGDLVTFSYAIPDPPKPSKSELLVEGSQGLYTFDDATITMAIGSNVFTSVGMNIRFQTSLYLGGDPSEGNSYECCDVIDVFNTGAIQSSPGLSFTPVSLNFGYEGLGTLRGDPSIRFTNDVWGFPENGVIQAPFIGPSGQTDYFYQSLAPQDSPVLRTPEPSVLLLFGLSVAGIGVLRGRPRSRP